MLLAVLNNDQATFDKIFEAANSQLWSGSSYKWNWRGGSGGATDAELDIALALVFADMLQQKKLWNPPSKTNYASRAKEVISTIRTRMCSQDYLLPGDSWGGGALDKQNPSYFATASMKVFDKYQTSHNFSKVIENCYQVLTKAPHYNKGQVPNWMTRNGGKTNPGQVSDNNPYGMGNDAIRTPWRIATDALWFNDARAVAYCGKTKGTLTAYNQSSVGLLKQMGLYKSSGAILPETIGSPDYTVMWLCGILGSKNKDYSTNAIKGRVVAVVTGPKDDFLGSRNVKDDKFYYKQAVGQLGFALITGQFPNIHADLSGNFQPLIKVSKAFEVSPATLTAPRTVTFSAEFSEPTDWVLQLTGKTTNVRREFRGKGKTLKQVWNGEGYPQKEAVEAVLKVKDAEAFSNSKTITIAVPYDPARVLKQSFTNSTHGINLKRVSDRLEIVSKLDFSKVISVSLFSAGGRQLGSFTKLQKTGENRWRLAGSYAVLTPTGLYCLAIALKGGATGQQRLVRKVLLN
jgi:hypothetical protein